jgi:peptide/nickel transport system substrate-binding protein
MLRRTTVAAAALLAAGALLLSACTGSSSPSPSGSTAAADPDATVAVRLVLEPSNLDIRETAGAALDQILIDNVYQGSSRARPTRRSSTRSPRATGLGRRPHLHVHAPRGVTFHDGQPLTPQDVVWSLQQVKDTATYRDSDRLANVTSIAANGQDIILTLSARFDPPVEPHRPRGPRPQGRRHDRPQDEGERHRPLRPRRLEAGRLDHAEAQRRLLGRQGEGRGGRAGLHPRHAGGTLRRARGRTRRRHRLRRDLKDQIEANGDFSLVLGKSTDKGTLAMNSTKGPLADKRVRQAIRQAIDKNSIVEALGAGQTLYGPIPELDPGYEDLESTAPFDPDAAKLLAEAGAEDITLTSRSRRSTARRCRRSSSRTSTTWASR